MDFPSGMNGCWNSTTPHGACEDRQLYTDDTPVLGPLI